MVGLIGLDRIFLFHSNCPYLVLFPTYNQTLVENPEIYTPHAFNAPVPGDLVGISEMCSVQGTP